MKRFIASVTFLFSILNVVGCGFDGFVESSDKQEITKQVQFDGPTISALKHDCSPDSDHHDEAPCNGDCHHHGHCHCNLINTATNLLCPSQDANQGMSCDQFHLSSYLDNLFRPPIA